MADVTTPGTPAPGAAGAGRPPSADAGQTGGDAATQAKDKAQEAAGQAKDKAQEAAGQAKEKAQEAKQQASSRLREQVDQRSTQAGEQVNSTASDLRTVGEELRNQGKETPAKLAEQAADRTERLGSYLRDSDSDRILNDVEDFARRQPWAVAVGGLLLGFAASRFLKASSSDRYRSRQEQQRIGTSVDRSPDLDDTQPTTTVSASPAVPVATGAPMPPPAVGAMPPPAVGAVPPPPTPQQPQFQPGHVPHDGVNR